MVSGYSALDVNQTLSIEYLRDFYNFQTCELEITDLL